MLHFVRCSDIFKCYPRKHGCVGFPFPSCRFQNPDGLIFNPFKPPRSLSLPRSPSVSFNQAGLVSSTHILYMYKIRSFNFSQYFFSRCGAAFRLFPSRTTQSKKYWQRVSLCFTWHHLGLITHMGY